MPVHLGAIRRGVTALTVPWGYVMILDDQPVSMRVRNDAPHLVALDIDGTLLVTGQRVPEPTVLAVQLVRGRRHHVVLASGRSLTGILPVAKELGITDGWVVASNGAVTARLCATCTNGYMLEDVLTFDVGPVAQMALSRFPDVQIGVEEIGVGYRVNREFPEQEISGRITIQSVDELVAEPVTRVVIRSPEHSAEEFHGIVDQLGLSDTNYYIGYTAWLDIAPHGVSKASGLQFLCEHLGIDPADTLAVGDGNNDREMLAWAGHGVAMGQAPADVQDAADEVTGTIEEDGLVPVLTRWL